MIARPRTAGTACSSWSEGVPRDFSLEASKAPVLFHQKWCFWDACWSWLGARPRTALWQTGGNGTHAVRSAVGRAVGRTAGQDCGTSGRLTGYSLSQAVFLQAAARGCSARQGRYYPNVFFTSRKEGASPVSGRGREPVSGKLGGFSWTFTQEGVRAKGAGPSGRNKPAGFPLTFVCLFVCLFVFVSKCPGPSTNMKVYE